MPDITISIRSTKPFYDQLKIYRHSIATALRAATSDLLCEIEDVEAFWFAPIDPDDTINTLPLSVSVEYSGTSTLEKVEQLAESLLSVLTQDPFSSEGIPFETKVGVRIKTLRTYVPMDGTKEVKQTIARRSFFPFGEEMLLLLVVDAPDAPDSESMWKISSQTVDGHEMSAFRERPATIELLIHRATWVLNEAIYSQEEVDKMVPEVSRWLNDVYEAYRSRSGLVPTMA